MSDYDPLPCLHNGYHQAGQCPEAEVPSAGVSDFQPSEGGGYPTAGSSGSPKGENPQAKGSSPVEAERLRPAVYSFRWIEDTDYYSWSRRVTEGDPAEPNSPIGDDEVVAEERRHFADGSWIALGCILQHECSCGVRHDTPVSLWGIVVEGYDDPYCREVERDLLDEAMTP